MAPAGSGWLALPADCLPVASQAVGGALLGYVAYSRACCTGRTTPAGDEERAVAPLAEDQHDKPGDMPEIREASNRRAHGFQGIITKRQGVATVRTPRPGSWNVGDHWQDVRPLKTAVQGLQLTDGDYRPTKCRCVYLLTNRRSGFF